MLETLFDSILSSEEVSKLIDALNSKVAELSALLPTLYIPAWRDSPIVRLDISRLGEVLGAVRILTAESVVKELSYIRLLVGERVVERRVGELFRKLGIDTMPEPQLVREDTIDESRTYITLSFESGAGRYIIDHAADGERSLLPILYATALLLGTGRGVVIVEEPELHTHPRLHHEVAKLVIALAKSGTQVVVTTHSDHFVAAIAGAVSEGAIKPDNISCYYLAREKGEVTAEPIELTPEGLEKPATN